MPFAIKKSRFKLSTPAKCTSHVKLSKGGQSTNIKSLKIQNVLRPWNQILAYKTMLWMSVVRTLAWCFHILEMSSIHTGEHTKQQRFKSKRRKIVKRQRLRYISQNDRLPLLSLLFSPEATRSFHSVMSDSWSAFPWKYDPGQVITEDVSSTLLLFSFRL